MKAVGPGARDKVRPTLILSVSSCTQTWFCFVNCFRPVVHVVLLHVFANQDKIFQCNKAALACLFNVQEM